MVATGAKTVSRSWGSHQEEITKKKQNKELQVERTSESI